MRTRKIASAAFTGAAAVATVGLATQTATAAPASGWHITPGNSTTFTLTNNGAIHFGGTSAFSVTCTRVTGTGHVSGDGKTAASASLAAINTVQFGSASTPCSVGGIPFTATLKRPTTLWGNGSQSAASVILGHIGNATASDISVSLNALGSISCHVEIRGATVPTRFSNSGHSLSLDASHAPVLHVTSVQGCLGLVNIGTTMDMSGRLSTNPELTMSYGGPGATAR